MIKLSILVTLKSKRTQAPSRAQLKHTFAMAGKNPINAQLNNRPKFNLSDSGIKKHL